MPPAASSGASTLSRTGASPRPAPVGSRIRALALTVLLIVATLFIGWLVWSSVEWRHGRTPAYRLLGLRIVRHSNGGPAGMSRTVRRELCCALLILPTIALCGVVAVSFVMGASPPNGLLRKPRTAPWDWLSDTEVVLDRHRPPLALGGDWPADGFGAGAGFGQQQN
jgi:RDD family